jgi:hypothetical protein
MPLKPILPDASIFFRTLSYQIEEVFEPPQRRPFPFFSQATTLPRNGHFEYWAWPLLFFFYRVLIKNT